ncbi:MAG TPA: response regulator, partial [Chloroflexota bacterium]|nr:response regulator [Chloroflexota bacterium]
MTDIPLPCSSGDSRPLRVLIADDSALMRQALRRVLTTDPAIEVVDAAYDGLDMLLKVERLQPDVVTLDVEMPRLDGLSALGLLMERFPRPVVMLSSLTDAGTEATVRALALGAVDFQLKPASQTVGGLTAIADELIAKVKRAAQMRV